MLPLRAIVNLGAMAMKGCSTFPKLPASLEPHSLGVSYLSAEMQSVYSAGKADWAKKLGLCRPTIEYSTAPANWAIHRVQCKKFYFR